MAGVSELARRAGVEVWPARVFLVAVIVGSAVALPSALGDLGVGISAGVTVTTRTTENKAPASPGASGQLSVVESVQTTTGALPSTLDRILNAPAILILRLGFVFLAAFVLAAIVQRVLAGKYGFSLGPLTVPEINREQLAEPAATVTASLAAPEPAQVSEVAGGLAQTTDDPNLRLVALRIELEKRLTALAERAGIQSNESLVPLIRRLASAGVLSINVAGALIEIVLLGNSAAHGATVSASAGQWAVDQGPILIAALDNLAAP